MSTRVSPHRHPCGQWLWMCAMAVLLGGCGETRAPETTAVLPSSAAGVLSPAHTQTDFTGFVTSEVCRECHAKQFESWHDSYHRTMTQEATEESVQGDFDDAVTQVGGYPLRLFRQDGGFFMTLINPDWENHEILYDRDPREAKDPPMVTFPVDRVIGSHHQQVYLSKREDGSYLTLPPVWDITRQRWITRGSSFLTHLQRGFYEQTKLWNNGCIFCHNTGPQPGLIPPEPGAPALYVWESHVAELGIACEACHGPGREHVVWAQQRGTHPDAETDETGGETHIVSPADLPQDEMVLVCARCHGKMHARPEFDRPCLVYGDFFRSGDWDYPDFYSLPERDATEKFDERTDGGYFWSDGTPRTTALEYQGLLLSACYREGELSCLTCHSMHNSDPDDQLRFEDDASASVAHRNRACTQCHEHLTDEASLAEHTHHAAESAGSACYDCHMPYQAYSLLKRVRSHRIAIPSSEQTAEHGIPNACNQCHVDKSLAWTDDVLRRWRGDETNPLPMQEGPSLIVMQALSGNALQRVLAVEQLADKENFDLAGIDWRPRILVERLGDDYAAVRLLAWQALQTLPGFEELQFDFIGTDAVRQAQIEAIVDQLSGLLTPDATATLRTLLGGEADSDVDELIETAGWQIDNVPMHISE